MKTKVYTETTTKQKVKGSSLKSSAKSLTLDQIEAEMTELALAEGNLAVVMANSRRIEMLEKVANLKMHRLQLKALEQQNEIVDVKPITVEFISAKTNDQIARIERIDKEIEESRNIKQDA